MTASIELTDCLTSLIRMTVCQAKPSQANDLKTGGNFRKSTTLHLLGHTYMIALLGSVTDT